jgi:peptidyl-prolyl cis-trans isomerase A (cyclophilin A)
MSSRAAGATLALAALAALGVGCNSSTPPEPTASTLPSYDPDWWASRDPARKGKRGSHAAPEKRPVHARPAVSLPPSPDDPLQGRWTLEEATAGLEAGQELRATIRTSMGELACGLWPDKAPITVANFVGLARGLRPWKTLDGRWEKRPAYDGSSFFRVLGGFVIQGGSPNDERDGDAGYVIPDEIWEGANHDRAGLLCMATLGHDKGSMQFFVTDAPALSLDGSFTIFGECGPLELVHQIASVEVDRGRPKTRVRIETVRIDRGSVGSPVAPASSASASSSTKPSSSSTRLP